MPQELGVALVRLKTN